MCNVHVFVYYKLAAWFQCAGYTEIHVLLFRKLLRHEIFHAHNSMVLCGPDPLLFTERVRLCQTACTYVHCKCAFMQGYQSV